MSYAVGLMSGTSLDGIDVALVEINNKGLSTDLKLVDFITVAFEKATKERIQAGLSIEKSNVAMLCSLNIELGQLFGEATLEICRKNAIASSDLLFVASHGQTLYHQPVQTAELIASTLQLGESSVITELTKTTVISDFRYRDMAVGGQGAPIVPYSEYVMYQKANTTRILQNIGGIGNATVLSANGNMEDVLAFDTGPGNMIIDELCRHFYDEEYDKDGYYGSQGTVNEEILSELMMHPYIQKPTPKTTGREDFGKEFTEKLLATYDLSKNDWLATATMFTVRTITETIKPFIAGETELLIGGGGSYNKTMLKMLKELLPDVKVMIQEDLGFSSEAKEAIAMTILGNQTYHHLPSNVPSATGASRGVILGKITYY